MGFVLRHSKAKGALSSREVDAAWRRKLIDRLAGIEVETPATRFDARQTDQPPLGANRQRSYQVPTRGLRDVIRPSLVARGIRSDAAKLTRGSRHPSKGAQILVVSLSSAVLTGLIWVSAYAVITDSAPGITGPIEAAVASVFAPNKSAAAQQVASSKPIDKPVEIAIADTDPDLAPLKANAVADAEAFPAPGLPAPVTANTATAVVEPVIEKTKERPLSPAPATSAAIAAVAPSTADKNPSPRDTVLAMLKSSESTVANTIGHLDANATPPTNSSSDPSATTPDPNVALGVSSVVPAIKIASVRHRIRTRIVHAQPAGTDGLAAGLMALGGQSSAATPEILPWQKGAAKAAGTKEVLPWLANAQGAKQLVRKGRFKTKVFRAASAATSQVLPTPGEMAFVAPTPVKARSSVRRSTNKSPSLLEQLINEIDQLTTVSSKHN